MYWRIDNSSGSNKIRLDISEFSSKKFMSKEEYDMITQYLLFNGSTYNIIRAYDKNPEELDHIFRAVNFVFARMENDDLLKIARFFAHASYCIKDTLGKFKSSPREMAGRSIAEFSKQLGDQYLEVVKETKLVDRFREYTHTQIHMQDTSTFGTRPQDTRELTFNEEEMHETNVIACLCKLASPIFGEIINNLPERIGEDGKKKLLRDKESRCVPLMSAIINEYFIAIIDKLQNYIHHIVMSMTAKNPDSAAIFSGLTPNTRTSIIMSSLLVRNYVSVELEKPDSNIIRYTDTMVRTLSQTQDSSAHRFQVKTRKAPGAMVIGDDSNNADQMEVDSLVSVGTMDGPILVKCAIDDVVTSHRRMLDISSSDFQKCLDFFKENPIKQTPLNMFAVTAVFGREIGGGRGVEMITSEPYTKLVAILQLIAFSMGYMQLGNFLTAAKSTEVKIQLTLEEENFKRQATTLSHYRACREQFSKSTITVGDQMWDKQMGIMLDDLASSIYLVNTPDYILDMVPEGATDPIGSMFSNGDILIPTVDMTEQLAALVLTYSRDIDL